MLRWITQTVIISLLGLASGFAVYLYHGEPDRTVKCDQSTLSEWEVCWDTVEVDWKGDVLWIDARSEREFASKHLDGAMLVREQYAESDLAEEKVMTAIGMAGMNQKKVVVYCATKECGASKTVAEKIRATGFHDQVYTLYGGWNAVPLELK